MTAPEALAELASATAGAITATLGMYGITDAVAGSPEAPADGASPFALLPSPGVATSVDHEGVAGGAVLGISLRGARMLAAAMMGQDPSSVDEGAAALSDLEHSAVSEAMAQIMAAAATATGAVLGTDVGSGPPELRTITTSADLAGFGERAGHVVQTALTVLGEPCRLVQLVPDAFVERMTGPPGEPEPGSAGEARPSAGDDADALGSAIMGTKLRVWAEVGRAKLPVGRVVGLPAGAVLELDRLADDPVDIFVNGHRYATGRLAVDDGGEWAVRLETILPPAALTAQDGR